METKWIKTNKLPNIEGRFWLYGKVWEDEKPKLYIIKIIKIANGFLYECRGQFLFENEIEGEFYITELFEPKLPI